jgi:MoCo/4Fe-4S cofactor protein with predicted Tat translocation signal
MSTDKSELNWTAIRERLRSTSGREYWQTLEELSGAPEFEEMLHREFPEHASSWNNAVDRRGFLRLMGASLALAGLGACTTQPLEKIIPYVRAPEYLVPGKPLFFATAMSLGGRAIGLLAESHMGRPTKIEGNPNHPASLGATDAFSQASILTLYDPERAQVVVQSGRIRSWSAFQVALTGERDTFRNNRGRGLRILTESVNSPAMLAQLEEIRALFPEARWHQYEPVNRDNALRGTIDAFGRPLNYSYRLERTRVLVSFGSNLLADPITGVRYARDFMAGRKVYETGSEMNRLYVVESELTNTGAAADHRLPVRPSEVEQMAGLLLAELSGEGERQGESTDGSPQEDDERGRWISAVARDLLTHRGSSLVVAGDYHSPAVHRIVHQINSLLGNLGQTIVFYEPPEADTIEHEESLRQLVQAMAAGEVQVLIILGANPVFTAPVDLDFAGQMSNVRLKIQMSLYPDETSRFCDWHLPQAHYLESWSDARALDGTVTIVQPLIEPLFRGLSPHELLALLTGELTSSYDVIRQHWQREGSSADFERFWVQALNDGIVPGTGSAEVQPGGVQGGTGGEPATAETDSLEILFRPDPTIYDGRFANNGWLQELPKPITKLTWDNAVLVSPADAERLQTRNGDVVEIQHQGRKVEGPVWIVPGQAEGCVTVYLGYGRQAGGRVGRGTGFDAYKLRGADSVWNGRDVDLVKTGASYSLASTQGHWSLEGRRIVRHATLAHYQENPKFVHEELEGLHHADFYPDYDYRDVNAWGMAIDLTACIGCNACVMACQAENNIPVVGKREVANQREMHWLRIDRYFEGNLENPTVLHQPMLCQHCEKAPCEVVCPVAATVHGAEGLNEMIYNRCVGTRYCSNNCPYKVRRFNFLQYSDKKTPSLQLLHNPDVTVRDRGVMEKCTYCVQRISKARIEAEKEQRPIADGEVVTACQAACPTSAIVFGNLNDPNSKVAQLKAQPLNYAVLAELNIQPRTTYLAALSNPNPELESE